MRRILGGSRSGHAVIEVALMAPWLLFLFLAVFNFGFFMYAGISVANASREAAVELARKTVNAGNTAKACAIVKKELEYLPNAGSFAANCTGGGPLTVTATALNDGAGVPMCRVRVSYTSIQLFPLPFLRGNWTLNRQTEVRVYQ